MGSAPGTLGSCLILGQARSLVSQELAWVVESMGSSGGGADQESGSRGFGLAGAWGFSGEPGSGSIWKVGFVGTHLSLGLQELFEAWGHRNCLDHECWPVLGCAGGLGFMENTGCLFDHRNWLAAGLAMLRSEEMSTHFILLLEEGYFSLSRAAQDLGEREMGVI